MTADAVVFEVSANTLLPELFDHHPATRKIFDRYGLRGCGGARGPVESVRFFARAHGVDEQTLLDEIRAAIKDPASIAALADTAEYSVVADTIYRRFFLGGIFSILTVGAVWGAFLLWRIGIAGDFTKASLFHVNAHGHAQIFGWVGLFIMGFAYQSFPRIWHTTLAWPRTAAMVFAMMLSGLLLYTVGMAAQSMGAAAVGVMLLGSLLEIVAVTCFLAQLLVTFRRSRAPFEPYIGFIIAALAWFWLQTVAGAWHGYATMTAVSREELIQIVATWQAPLRDIQIHGLALFMIVGVSLRMLPGLFNVPQVPPRQAWTALALLFIAVIAEVAVFLAFRITGISWLAALLLPAWLLLFTGIAILLSHWKPWRAFPESDRSAKFVRTAFGWLVLSLMMMMLLPIHQALSGISFSHAYYGAIRHAITVGFISQMILGYAAKAVPTLNGFDTRRLTPLWGPYVLLNGGCFLRVGIQTGTDWAPGLFPLIGISGVLEVIALGWWGTGLVRLIIAGKRIEQEQTAVEAGQITSIRPRRVKAEHRVGKVLEWYPQTEEVFLRYGFRAIKNPILRRTVAAKTPIAAAATIGGVDLETLLRDLNRSLS